MKDELYTGYTESAEQIADRWQRIKAKSFACDVYGEELTDAEAEALRQALELAETEDEREAQNREAAAITDWLQANNAAGQYGERAYISGGEVCYSSDMVYRPASEPDDDMPF